MYRSATINVNHNIVIIKNGSSIVKTTKFPTVFLPYQKSTIFTSVTPLYWNIAPDEGKDRICSFAFLTHNFRIALVERIPGAIANSSESADERAYGRGRPVASSVYP